MTYALLAVIVAVFCVSPMLIALRVDLAMGVGVVVFLILWGIFYLATPSVAYPLGGSVAWAALVGAVIVGVIVMVITDGDTTVAVFAPGALLFIGLVLSWVPGWGIFSSSDYAHMIGPVTQADWTTSIQPKDPKHMLMVSKSNALYLAKKAVGSAGTIGSQFSLDTDAITLQKINGRLMYAMPFDYNGFTAWKDTDGSPGFMLIDGQDPQAPVQYVKLKEKMIYTPDAWFGEQLERHMRAHGYMDVVLGDPLFEVDDHGKPWWVIPTEKPTIAWDGLKVTGVAIVSPSTGAIKHYSLKRVPVWVDRVIPGSLITQYLLWRGEYSGGWWNSVWAQANMTQPEDPLLIYGSNTHAEWVSGITSTSSNDDSLTNIVFVDSRTGKAMEYDVAGGATESAIKRAINTNSKVQYRHLHASSPQIYNVYGKMTAVVPLLNDSNAFQGVAIVALKDVQDVAVGTTQNEALRNYQVLLFRRGQQVALSKAHSLKVVTGVVYRIHQDVQPGSDSSPYYIYLRGVPRIFTASSQDYPTLPITQPGDKVVLKYIASGESVVPVQSFNNPSLPLDVTAAQKQVTATALEQQNRAMKRANETDARKRFLSLPPAQQLKLMQQHDSK